MTVLADIQDHRWDDQLSRLASTMGSLDERWIDLYQALRQEQGADTQHHIYFDHHFTPDRLHVERIVRLGGVQLHPRKGGGHTIAREMRASGELEALLRSSLGASG